MNKVLFYYYYYYYYYRRQNYNAAQCRQNLRNPLKFAFLTIFGCKTPYLGGDVMVLYLQLMVRNWVIQCVAVRYLFKRTYQVSKL